MPRSKAVLILLLTLAVLLGRTLRNHPTPSHAAPKPVSVSAIPLIDTDFEPALRSAISKAKKEIFCVMYMAQAKPERRKDVITTILKALVKAHKRGIKVTVILDHNRSFWKSGRAGKKVETKSGVAYEWLKAAGVPVFFDDKERITHSKVFIMDNQIAFVGSHNLTYSALRRNHETSVRIDSPRFASELKQGIERAMAREVPGAFK